MPDTPAPPRSVKTTVDLPVEVWRAAKIRAMDDQTDLRSVVIAALTKYLDGVALEPAGLRDARGRRK